MVRCFDFVYSILLATFSLHGLFRKFVVSAADDPGISKYFGHDSTPGGLEFQFRTFKANAKRQKACADAGGDPQSLAIGVGKSNSSRLIFNFPILFPAQHSTNTIHWTLKLTWTRNF